MTWTATIERIAENPVPNGTRSFRREMKVSPGSVADAGAVTAALAAEVAALEAADRIAVDLASVVGSEINAAAQRPGTVKMWQARAALRNAGLFDTANALIVASGNAAWVEAWEYAPEISRTSPMVNAMGQALGLTSEQVDDLFAQAATITV